MANSKSLSEVVRHHGALCVNPLFWTSPLLDLLGCRFNHVDNAMQTAAQPSIDDGDAYFGEDVRGFQPLRYTECDAHRLSVVRAPVSKRCIVGRMLVREGGAFKRCCYRSEFFFAKRSVHRSDCDVFEPNERLNKCFGQMPRLLVGYLHYSYVEGARRQLLRPPRRPGGDPNVVGQSISRRKLSKVTPKEWFRDPYLSRLLVTTTKKPDREFIYLYEAAFASELLEMLDNPTLATERATWPTIRLKKIPFEPYADFQPRIIAELLAPIA
ncbi:hypothetical protein OCS_00316 [Ophiocordyceps sinensis CO18]|uniref:Uncharacterized protein n=1 Tax=Ophiocordyceps sinensis (strain Co18 / CGMCC 3.14243) TaxID=911162 RepID=T5AQD3_OPHSC|nr:hypothetical protein OCS_00316 [Ophiocordyceps sinensis CO18]